ncbi:coniferyl-alcohol dehydrogenase [Novosphingobium sp. MMS21-SN21R]|uniref:coniferyl-alcohol dehydrogenase n=1 Tax=Novosphingobium sp. MMS21-SN21R TaxID=2969298 RepID=UPI0028868B35|nr:coniferyl-alcohol dehydrogenase [Novosphingobium sp. MMS21-SN21R]MDT0509919.1 coniferyl-alcohol dehydrogenase [Novosphingobium sp. MMS21-SN21R]
MPLENNSSYAGKRVVVVGCHSGIGHAAARLLLDCGAHVHGLDWKPCDLPLDAFTQVDLRESSSINRALAECKSPVDALFNCAGIPPGAPPVDVMKVNYIGTRHLTDGIAPLMQPGSAIVNVASTGGMGWPHHLADLRNLIDLEDFDAAVEWCASRPEMVTEGYRFSKEAVIVWTMMHSASLIGRGIRMNCTLPGAVQTPMLVEIEKVTPTAVIDQVAQPIGRRSSADEQAAVLLFLGSDAAGYINGAVLPVDGGFMASIGVR